MAPRSNSLLQRCAMGLWLAAVAALGLLQFGMRAFDDGVFAPGPVAWLWLAGSVVVAAIAAVVLLRVLLRARRR
jgi:hypothetical protein